MNDAAQAQNAQDGEAQAAGNGAPNPQQIPNPQSTQQTPPTQPVSHPHKELGPAMATQDYDVVAPSQVEPELHPEVAEAGVEVTTQTHSPQIHPDAAKHGLTVAKDATPVITTPSGIIKLPLTEEKALTAKKAFGIKDSMRWLAELVLEQIKRARQKVVN